MTEKSVCQIVRQAETNYLQGNTVMGKYVSFSMHDTIERVDAYLNSKHIQGEKDNLGREKPFFNIVTAACNIWYRATDLDRRNIKILPNGSALTAHAFIATQLLQQWMDKAHFGVFLNKWGRTLARYGSAVVKFVEQDGEFKASVIPWNRMIVDPVDFDALPRIEKFYKTEEQLYQMVKERNYSKEMVENLCDSLTARRTLDRQQKDNQSHFIELYEVHGLMSQAVYKLSKGEDTSEADEDIYFQQMHVISFVSNKEGEFDDFTLYSGREAEDPYMLTHLIEEDGRTLSIGAVEYLFDAQWMQNHTMKQWKDQLDLASRVIFQTSDGNFVGRNVLTAIETGDILVYDHLKSPLTSINNQGRDIGSLQGFSGAWKANTQELVSTPDAIQGTTMPSGTAYRQVAILNQEAHSLFEVMTENKGLDLEEMVRKVIRHLKKKMDNKDEIVSILNAQGISQIDAMYVPRQAIRNHNERVLKQLGALAEKPITSPIQPGDLPQPFNPQQEQAQVQQDLAPQGNMRTFSPDDLDEKTWKEALKDLEWNVKVEITNENTDKQSKLDTLSSVFKDLAQMGDTKNARVVLGKLLTETGAVSPLELATSVSPVAAPAPTGSMGGTGGLVG